MASSKSTKTKTSRPAAARAADRQTSREAAAATLTDVELRLNELGAAYSTALNQHTTRAIQYVTDVLGDGSEPEDWVKDGLALWLNGYQTQLDLYSGLLNSVCPSPPPIDDEPGATPKKGSPSEGDLVVDLDQASETADSVVTDFPDHQLPTIVVSDLLKEGGPTSHLIFGNAFPLHTHQGRVCLSLHRVKSLQLKSGTYVGTVTGGQVGNFRTAKITVHVH